MSLLNLFRTTLFLIRTTISDALHLAVPAPVYKQSRIPRYRPLGRAVLPYHFMRPALVPARNTQR